jgi:TRAF3-interacting protein 1
MFSSLLERPRMSGKLLVKPPFSYIYDITVQCSKFTGFAKGMFSDKIGLYSGEEITQKFYEEMDRQMTYI